MSKHLAVINTADPSYHVMRDAARPYAVVECFRNNGEVTKVLSRHETYKGACISCGRKAAKRRLAANLTKDQRA